MVIAWVAVGLAIKMKKMMAKTFQLTRILAKLRSCRLYRAMADTARVAASVSHLPAAWSLEAKLRNELIRQVSAVGGQGFA